MLIMVSVYVLCVQVAGNTQYNLVKFNEVLTDKSDRPLEPIKVFRAEVHMLPW